MTTITKAFVFNYIKQYPGCRRRDMPGWRAQLPLYVSIIDDLVDEGKVEERLFSDPAQMEQYYQYYAKES